MKNFPFVVFEGISYAGKTTLSNLCKNKGITVLKELSEISSFPELAKENDKLGLVDKWFYDQHASRIEEILNATNFNTVILDRYFLSDLAYISARYNTYDMGGLDFYQSLLYDGFIKKEILVPWFVYVSIDIELYMSRKLVDEANLIASGGINKRVRTPYSNKKKLFFENQILFYDSFFYKNKDNVLVIDGNLDPNYLCKQVIEWIDQLPQALPKQTLNL